MAEARTLGPTWYLRSGKRKKKPTLKEKDSQRKRVFETPRERGEQVIIERKEMMSSAQCTNPAEMFHNDRDWKTPIGCGN